MAAVAGEARAENQVSATRANQAIGIGTAALDKDLKSLSTSLSAKSQVSTRARRPRTWFMPARVAKSQTSQLARAVAQTTTPDEFDPSDPDLPGSQWVAYGAGDCQRKSPSRVNCVGAVYSEPYEIIDENDQVIGEDEFICAFRTDVWYPRARTKKLKIKVTNSGCGWVSDL